MNKNKKGFTLVELLAAIVILGILAMFALPMVTRMIDSSRNKMYVEDARKLIARAEYQMKASSSTIIKPDEGDCIIISMAYLQASEITTAPNGGEYNQDQSYVVIKNAGNDKYDYAAAIVEDLKKGGHKGILLTDDNRLTPTNAASIVVTVGQSDLVDIEHLSSSYIRTKIPDYVTGDVVAIYHYHEITDDSVHHVTDSTPRLEPPTYNDNGNLTAKIEITAIDDDTNLKDLKVYYSTDESNKLKNETSYGNSAKHMITINFGASPYNYDHSTARTVKVYITVKDPEGHVAEATVSYWISANRPPDIDEHATKIEKRPSDSYNGFKANITLVATDDSDDVADLEYCVADTSNSSGATSCGSYKKYQRNFEYEFKCGGNCVRDGNPHYATVFVRDTSHETSKIVLTYVFSSNASPTLDSVTVQSVTDQYPSDQNKNVNIRVRASDDEDVNKLVVYVNDGHNYKTFNYSDDNNQNIFPYTVTGEYNGDIKDIRVYVQDADGAVSATKTVQYQLHDNHDPEISYFNVRSFGQACNKGNLCVPIETEDGTKNGALSSLVEIGIYDDLDIINDYADTQVCISATRSYCNDASHFEPYANYYGMESQFDFTGTYDGSKRTLYAVVKDSGGRTAEASADYWLYKDSKPEITDFSMMSDYSSFAAYGGNSTTSTLNLSAMDDFSEDNDMLLYLKCDGNTILDGVPVDSIYEPEPVEGITGPNGETLYNNVFSFTYTIPGNHDGTTHHFEATVKDNNNQMSEKATFDYELFNNTGPTVSGAPSVTRGKDNYNTSVNLLDVYFNAKFQDDVDQFFNAKYCYTTGTPNPDTDTCTDVHPSTGIEHLTKENLFSNITSYNGQKLKLYAVAYDSLDPGLTVQTATVEWQLYKHSTDAPSILYSAATYNNSLTTNNVTVYFQAKYLFDTYQVCIAKDTSGCTNYVGPNGSTTQGFDGMDFAEHSVQYTYGSSVTATSPLYLYVRGVTVNQSKYAAISSIVAAGNCAVPDMDNPKYEYTFNNVGTQLTIGNCSRKCYHKSVTGSTNYKQGEYKIKITYNDRVRPNTSCPGLTKNTTGTKYCDFLECFKENNSYEQVAIGTLPIVDSNPWLFESGDYVYINYSHYEEFKSSYTTGDKNITLTRQTRMISPFALDNNKYTFNYVRVSPY